MLEGELGISGEKEVTLGRIKEAKAGIVHLSSNVQPALEEIPHAANVLIGALSISLCGAWLMRKWSPPVFSPVQITSDMHRQEEKKESTLVVRATEMQSGKALLRLCSRNSSKNLPKQGKLSGRSFYIRSCCTVCCCISFVHTPYAQGIIYKRGSSSTVAA